MNHVIKLTHAEAEGIKLALTQLIDERDLAAATSLLETSMYFSETENVGMRKLMFQALFSMAHAKPTASPTDLPH
ncbi:hypothetical protein [Ruegeria arenilitoris]|uniref:hypothetical protein n=1 Tax=Ruegeria arenilitoris TaxID=1173585 RepID=UPI00147B73B9|nr:hypothetical protein [Ruegeria arenilitoris]